MPKDSFTLTNPLNFDPLHFKSLRGPVSDLAFDPNKATIYETVDAVAAVTTPYAMTTGDTFYGSLSEAGDEDAIAISMVAGESYAISLFGGDTGVATLLDYRVYIYDDGGHLLDYSWNYLSHEAYAEFQAQETGTYYLVVESPNDEIGSYALSVERTYLDETSDAANSETTHYAMTVDSQFEGAMGFIGDVDWIAIDLVAGETYSISNTGYRYSDGTLSNPAVAIYDASSILLTDEFYSLSHGAFIEFTAGYTGTYYIAASDDFGDTNRLGTYTVSVRSGYFETADAEDDMGGTYSYEMSVGETFHGEIDTDGDQDTITLQLSAGQSIALSVAALGTQRGTLEDPILVIRDAAGTIIASNDNAYNADSYLEGTAPSTGTYYIQVASASGTGTGTYDLRVSAYTGLTELLDAAANGNTYWSIGNQGIFTGEIAAGADRDWVWTYLEAGTSFSLDARGVSSGGGTLANPYLRVMDANGNLLIGDNNSGEGTDAYLEYTVQNAGNYFIEVSAAGDYSNGSYSLEMNFLRTESGDAAADIFTEFSMSVGERWNGNLFSAGDRDWVEIFLAAGATYEIAVSGTGFGNGSLTDSMASLYDAEGNLLVSNDNLWNEDGLLTFTAQTAGVYFVEASGATDTETGDYTIWAYELDLDEMFDIAGEISTNQFLAESQTLHAAIGAGPESDRDMFEIHLQAGEEYAFRVLGVSSEFGTLLNPYLYLLDASAGTIDFDDDSHDLDPEITFTAATTGTYYLMVGDQTQDSPGTYAITYTNISSLDETDDAAQDSSTVYSMELGETFRGSLDTFWDRDWVAIDLAEGQYVEINLKGTPSGSGTLSDPYLRLYDASGNQIAFDDDSGIGYESHLTFLADYTGTYYISAGSYNDNDDGTYLIETSEITNPMQDLADYLISGYWNSTGRSARHFDTSESNQITVDITALTAEGQQLARWAFEAWEAVANLSFVEVTGSSAMITFDDSDSGAYSSSVVGLGGLTESSFVNVSTAWLASYGTLIGSYSLQTYIHEIGHALGLGHQGPYNGSATYGVDNEFLNDSWAASVMSYFDQDENTAVDNSFAYLLTTMMADVLAIQEIYGDPGASATTTGATVWGVGSNLTGYLGLVNSILSGTASSSYYNGNPVAGTIYDAGGVDSIILNNSPYANFLDMRDGYYSNINGGIGNIAIAFGTSIEKAFMGTGNDTVVGNDANNWIDGGGGIDSLLGGAGNDTILGGGGDDLLDGGNGNDSLQGGAGNDTMIGGLGDDIFLVGNAGDVVVENVGEGTDEVQSWISFELRGMSQYIENLTLLGTGAVNATGNGLNNIITGNDGNNVLNGAWGNDTIYGGAGNDTIYDDDGSDSMAGGLGDDVYRYDNLGDTITEYLNEGTDRIETAMSLVMSAISQNVENLTLTGTGNINGTGNALNNVLTGNSGNNRLDGALGSDTMIGGLGDDTYVIDTASDVIVEASGEGTDTVESKVTFDLRTYGQVLENLLLTGSGNTSGTGNGQGNVITGNAGNNVLNGAWGNDTIYGGAGNDTIRDDFGVESMFGGLGDDTYVIDNAGDTITEYLNQGTDLVESAISVELRLLSGNLENLTLTGTGNINGAGNALNNVITGNAGNNILDGALGADTMIGGEGDDTYIVDSTGDRITELLNQGTDTVLASFSFALRDRSQNLENLTLTGSSDLDGIGNALDNVLTGNSGANRLNGALGDDTMIGGYGDDTFVVNSTGDRVTEYLNQGHDRIESSISLALRDISQNVEELKLTGTANLNGTGNALDNLIAGNAGNNVLDGALGADTMIGGEGDDTYILDDLGDVVTEYTGQGTDTVKGGISLDLRLISQKVENIVLTGTGNIDGYGNGLNNVITGNDGNNVLNGAWGNDTLDGGAGNDTLSDDNGNDVFFGGAGADLFIFVDGFGNDVIKDFNTSEVGEYIDLSHVSEIAGFDDLMANHLSSNEYGNAVIDDGHGNSIILQGVAMNSLLADDFLFSA
jgi:serralysin